MLLIVLKTIFNILEVSHKRHFEISNAKKGVAIKKNLLQFKI
ncbi:hypothetical protein HOLDEFILI_02169 [Holdemania filiformis DSM 12042]|uniref:Uncharacterized protein n=1 Tax=Holdemania filiformis DSM 12042 TaxID=545696 RepID=B9Y8M2_9FIRM|nr:hypothetical protein HOLDEFILI_02169 [Holdemania filiformis DSM 12042]